MKKKEKQEDRKILAEIAAVIKKSKTFFIAGHIKPDGDTVGSGLALASLLERLGKKVRIYTREIVPEYLCFLPGSGRIRLAEQVIGEFDCAIILECSDLDRMGNIISIEQASTLINIDHHAVFNNYGHINYIKPEASSSAEQIFYLFNHLKMPLKRSEAESLYVGLITDTGKFQQANTTPAALRMAAALLEAGVVPARMYDRLYATKSLSSLNLLGGALTTLRRTPSGKVAYMNVTRQDYKRTRSDVTETEGIINYAMMIPGVSVAMLLRETETTGTVKASLRSRDGVDVNKVARHFGGGGHKNAAGCTFEGTLKSAEKRLVDYLRRTVGL